MCGERRALVRAIMRYRVRLPHHRLFLDALFAAVLLTILGLASSNFIQALVGSVFIPGRKPALKRSCLLACPSQRITAENLPGLPLAFFVSPNLTRRALLLCGAAF